MRAVFTWIKNAGSENAVTSEHLEKDSFSQAPPQKENYVISDLHRKRINWLVISTER